MKRLTQERSYFVAKDNQLITKSRYSLSLSQQKILLYFISRIKPFDDENTMYEFKIKEFMKVCGLYDNSSVYYKKIKQDIKDLADVSSWIEVEKGKEVLFRWINEAEILPRSGKIHISFHKSVVKYLFELRERYTQYSLNEVLVLSHKYSIRLYEYLCAMRYRQEFEISVDELKKRLDVDNYDTFAHFRQKVLDPAMKDIDYNTDLLVSYITKKTGKKITHICFKYLEKDERDIIITRKLQEHLLNPQSRKAINDIKKDIVKRTKEREEKIIQEQMKIEDI